MIDQGLNGQTSHGLAVDQRHIDVGQGKTELHRQHPVKDLLLDEVEFDQHLTELELLFPFLLYSEGGAQIVGRKIAELNQQLTNPQIEVALG